MDNENLYNSPKVANIIKNHAKSKKIALKDMLSNLNMGSNTFSHMLHGKSIAFDSLARIADYLDCSVDYLLGRTDDPELHTLKANNRTSEAKLQIPIKKEAPKASEKELQFIRTAASTGNTGMDNGYKAPKQPYSKKDRAEIKKLKDIEDLE